MRTTKTWNRTAEWLRAAVRPGPRSGVLWTVTAAAALAGCGVEDEAPHGTAIAHVGSTSAIPLDGRCTWITSFRLSDFEISTYQGLLAGASFAVEPGEAVVNATAYPEPCDAPPPQPPWISDQQITTFTGGANVLVLDFHPNPEATGVTIDPTFDGFRGVEVYPDSARRLSRNGEDAASPFFGLDGWNVTQLALPPAAPSETLLFSLRGKDGMTLPPRGLAYLHDGTLATQTHVVDEPLRRFDSAGTFLERWPVVYPADKIRWDFTDGLEAESSTRLVRTGYLNAPVQCDEHGEGCIQAGIEILEKQTDTNGAPVLVVTEQIPLPEAFQTSYPVGIAKAGPDRYAVATLPVTGGSELILIGLDGALLAGPVADAGSFEGLFDLYDGRIAALGYGGELRMFHAIDASPDPAGSASYGNGLGLAFPRSLAWDRAAGEFLALSTDKRIVRATPDFSSVTPLPIDLSGYVNPGGMDYLPGTHRLAVVDRTPPLGEHGARAPRVDFYDLATSALASSTTLAGLPNNLRVFSLAYDSTRQQLLTHYRLPSNAADYIDAIVYRHGLDGTVTGAFDLRGYGFKRIYTVNYLPDTDELLLTAQDITNRVRLVVTSPTGFPRRSYRTEQIADVREVAPITSGPYAGDLGVLTGEPSEYLRAVLE